MRAVLMAFAATVATFSIVTARAQAEDAAPAAPPVAAAPAQNPAAPLPKASDVVLTPATAAQVLEAVHKAGAKAVVVNVWATWCTPCREEFPDVLRFYRSYRDRGVTLLLVSGDFASETDAAREFLASQGVDFPSYLKTGKDSELIDAFDPQWSGALPATFVYDGRGQRVRSLYGPVTFASLEREVQPLLGVHP